MPDQPTFSPAAPAGGYPPAGGRPSRRSSRPALLIAGGAVAAVLVAGGGAFAVQRLNQSALQPEDVLPDTAIAFVRVDLDPSMGQKLAAFRLMDKLPGMKDSLAAGDPKQAVFEQLRKASGTTDVDYDKDVAPWLGDRFAVAMLPGADKGKLLPVMAVAVKDEAKAREGIDRLAQKGRDRVKKLDGARVGSSPIDADEESVNVFRDGYVLTMPKSAEAKVVAAIDAGVLAKKAEYVNDMKALGDPGVASAWYDPLALQSALGSAVGQETMPGTDALQGLTQKAKPVASALRFGADYVEMVSNAAESGLLPAGGPVKDIATLPSDTVAVASMAGAGDAVGAIWGPLMGAAEQQNPDVKNGLLDIEKATGIRLPDDLQTLLGKQTDLIVPDQDFADDVPLIGARLDTDTAKAERVLDKVEAFLADQGQPMPLFRETRGGKLYLATDNRMDALTGSGDLGASALATAVPQLQDARSMFFVDLDKLEKLYVDSAPTAYRDAVRSLRAVGMSLVVKDGREIGTVRLVVN